MPDALDLKPIKTRWQQATPGPWIMMGLRGIKGPHSWVVAYATVDILDRPNGEAIAHAPEDVSALIAEVERLRGENAELRSELHEWAASFMDACIALSREAGFLCTQPWDGQIDDPDPGVLDGEWGLVGSRPLAERVWQAFRAGEWPIRNEHGEGGAASDGT